jgi:hypothetical protein
MCDSAPRSSSVTILSYTIIFLAVPAAVTDDTTVSNDVSCTATIIYTGDTIYHVTIFTIDPSAATSTAFDTDTNWSLSLL